MGTLGLIGGLPTAIGMVLAWPIADKLGKQRAVTLGLAVSVVGGLVSFINVHSFTIVCAGVILKRNRIHSGHVCNTGASLGCT